MGPEIIAATFGPLFGGMISMLIWSSKKNADRIDNGFTKLNTTVNVIERKVDGLQLEVVKNYATRDDIAKEIVDLKNEMKAALELSRERGEHMYEEIEKLRKLYWDTQPAVLYKKPDG